MLNTAELIAIAERPGFVETSLIPPGVFGDGDCDKQAPYSVCVAAPSFNVEDRYRPFNFKKDSAAALIERNLKWLRPAARMLSPGGLMFIYGLPAHIARYAAALSGELTFKRWIAVRTMTAQKAGCLRPEHTALLVLSGAGAPLNRVRIPHAKCRYCEETLRDWGGKSHLMHPDGVALSDVWMDLVVDPEDCMPPEVFERILQLSSSPQRANLLLLLEEAHPLPAINFAERPNLLAFNPLKSKPVAEGRKPPDEIINCLHRAPCLDVLKLIPSETVDVAFADPPFNLMKNYNGYRDDKRESDYLGWCKRWLVEYERVLKPGGALFLLNLPKWSALLADFLSRSASLYFQNWIVWNSLPEPKGALMPAHYGLLYFTKGESAARFNYCSMENGWEPFDEAVFPPDRSDVCQRSRCVRKRRASGKTWRGEMTDIWYDIHRERQKDGRAARLKAHPCQTPERLIDRIIRLATNPGDLVLDAFAGTGTTALVAGRLGRRFIAIEQNDEYLQVAERRLSEPARSRACSQQNVMQRKPSKRGLQLELKRLALALGRLPTKADVEAMSKYRLETFESAFASWNAALKAAKNVVGSSNAYTLLQEPQMELFNPTASLKVQPVNQSLPAQESGDGCEQESSPAISAAMTDENAGSEYLIS